MRLSLSWQEALRLGRVSALPTVWTNLLAGLVLAGGSLIDWRSLLILAALTFAHLGGGLLNDAFDSGHDADSRPERPIPAGHIGRGTVFAIGFALLALALAPLYPVGLLMDPIDYPGTNHWPLITGLLLVLALLLYDWRHRHNPWAPAVFAACRPLAYLVAGLSFAMPPSPPLLVGAAMLFCYAIGVGFFAGREQEADGSVPWLFYLFIAAPLIYGLGLVGERPHILPFWVAFAAPIAVGLWMMRRNAEGDGTRAQVSLLAGVALFDALMIAGTGALGLAALALLGFLLTLALSYVAAED